MEPSDRKTGPIDPISYTMIVSGLLHPFLTILDYLDSYHALATLYKLENLGNLAFFGNFCVKNGRNCTFQGPKIGSKNRSKSSYIGQNFKFLTFLVTLGQFWTILKKKKFLRFFDFFFKPKYVFLGFLQSDAIFGPKNGVILQKSQKNVFGLKKKN